MPCYTPAHKILALVVIVALLAMRLSALTEKVFVTPVEDAVFDIPFIAAEDGSAGGKPPKVKPKRAFDLLLPPVEQQHSIGERIQTSAKPALALLNPKEILSEIFIPPESVS